MDDLWLLTLLVGFGAALAFALRRSAELFVLSLRGGRVRHVRGRLPPALFQDLSEILEQLPAGSRVLVRVIRERGTARLLVQGPVSEAHVQRMRNVLGRFHLAQIRGGRPPAARGRN